MSAHDDTIQSCLVIDMKKSYSVAAIAVGLLAGCNDLSKDAQKFESIVKESFSEASIVTTQGKTGIDYLVMFERESFPQKTSLINFFSKNSQDLYNLCLSQNMKEASVNYGVYGEGIRYTISCINQGLGLCDIGTGSLSEYQVLNSVCYNQCGN